MPLRSSPLVAFAVAGCASAAVLTACGSGASGKAVTSAACVTPVASASAYDSAVTKDKLLAAAAASSSASADITAARTDQAKLELAWAQLIYAHASCFPDDSVAAAKEYLTGPGR